MRKVNRHRSVSEINFNWATWFEYSYYCYKIDCTSKNILADLEEVLFYLFIYDKLNANVSFI